MIGVLVTVVYEQHIEDRGYMPSITSQYITFQSMEAVQDFNEELRANYGSDHDYAVKVTVFGGVV